MKIKFRGPHPDRFFPLSARAGLFFHSFLTFYCSASVILCFYTITSRKSLKIKSNLNNMKQRHNETSKYLSVVQLCVLIRSNTKPDWLNYRLHKLEVGFKRNIIHKMMLRAFAAKPLLVLTYLILATASLCLEVKL